MTTATTSTDRGCDLDGCTERHYARGLCPRHYRRAQYTGQLAQHPKRPRRAGQVCPPDHAHATTHTCYRVHGCICEPCLVKQREGRNQRSRAKAYGTYVSPLVDAAPVREHLRALMAAGIGYKRACTTAGVNPSIGQAILYGKASGTRGGGQPSQTVHREHAEAILAVPIDTTVIADGARVSAVGVHRRIGALLALGHPRRQVCEWLGVDSSNLSSLLRKDTVTMGTHRRIAAIYAQVSMLVPARPDPRSLAAAAAAGWAPPLAWDDIDQDPHPAQEADADEQADVDEVAIALALDGVPTHLNGQEKRAFVTRAHQRRWSDLRIAADGRMTAKTVARIRGELDLAPWPQEEQAAA